MPGREKEKIYDQDKVSEPFISYEKIYCICGAAGLCAAYSHLLAVQKFAKKLLSKYWGVYTGLGDSFLENLQGLTTLKIYQADEQKAEEMDEEAQDFRRITMKVLTMQLNSTSVMDVIAYGAAERRAWNFGRNSGILTVLCWIPCGA